MFSYDLKIFCVIGLTTILVCLSCLAEAGGDKRVKADADKAVRQGQMHAAFMKYRSLWRDFPHSSYAKDALFFQGEFQYQMPNLKSAVQIFQTYHSKFENDTSSIFALAYLYKIAEKSNDQKLKDEIQQEIAKQSRVSLVFRDHKEVVYESPMGQIYKARIFIDQIKFYVQEIPFTSISFE